VTAGGWITMLLSVGTVTVLFAWCVLKVLRTPEEPDKVHGFEFETPDERAERDKN
jgi:hypothetical protein